MALTSGMTQRQMIEMVQQHHPDVSETQIRIWLNQAMQEFCRKTRILRGTDNSIVTVANKRWYTLPSDILEVILVNYDGFRINKLIGVPEEEADVEMPTLLLPANGSSSVSGTRVLDWSDVWNANEYQLQIATDSSFASTLIDTTVTSSTYTCVHTINTTYYWRVRAKNEIGNSAWTASWSFKKQQGGE